MGSKPQNTHTYTHSPTVFGQICTMQSMGFIFIRWALKKYFMMRQLRPFPFHSSIVKIKSLQICGIYVPTRAIELSWSVFSHLYILTLVQLLSLARWFTLLIVVAVAAFYYYSFWPFEISYLFSWVLCDCPMDYLALYKWKLSLHGFQLWNYYFIWPNNLNCLTVWKIYVCLATGKMLLCVSTTFSHFRIASSHQHPYIPYSIAYTYTPYQAAGFCVCLRKCVPFS